MILAYAVLWMMMHQQVQPINLAEYWGDPHVYVGYGEPTNSTGSTIHCWRQDGAWKCKDSTGKAVESGPLGWSDVQTNPGTDSGGTPASPVGPNAVMWDEEKWKAVEPVDVPAIRYEVPAPYPCNLSGGGSPATGGIITNCMTGPETRWTCEQKFRILLTSEDGKKHCIRF